MDKQRIREELKSIFGIVSDDITNLDAITDDTSIMDGLGLDSLQVAEVLFEVEDKLGVNVSDDEARNLRTVGELIHLIAEKMPGEANTA